MDPGWLILAAIVVIGFAILARLTTIRTLLENINGQLMTILMRRL